MLFTKNSGAGVNFDDPINPLVAFKNWPRDLMVLIPILAMIGVAALYSSTLTNPNEASLTYNHFSRFWFGYVVMLGLGLIHPNWWMALAWPAYGVGIALLLAVFAFGVEGGQATRWLSVFSIKIQPSELMKLSLVLCLARYYHIFGQISQNTLWIHMGALALTLLPAGLVAIQPDLGTALTLLACGGTMIFFAGLGWRIILGIVVLAIAAAPLAYFVVLEPYQRARVDTFMSQMSGGGEDSLGASYQIEQAHIAIGSGGWFGKGFTNGTQSQLDYIPEQHTDFILTVIAEEMGFFGVLVLLSIWAWIFARAIYFANLCASVFPRFAAIGSMALIAFYVMFNTGMVFGVLPVVGIPMPLISYGGSAMITVLFAFALIASARIYRAAYIPSKGLL